MAKILYFPNPSEYIEAEAPLLGDWMLEQWPVGSVRPRGMKIYKDSVCNENDITQKWVTDESVLMDENGTYILVILPAGPAIPFIPYIIAAVAFVAAYVLAPRPGLNGVGRNSRVSSSNNSLQGRTNSPRPGERIADIRGGVRAYPDLLMDYRIFYEGSEYEVQFLCIGSGEYDLSDIRDGLTPASNITGTSLSFYRPDNSPGMGSPYLKIGEDIDLNKFPIMTAKSSNEADGSELRPPNYSSVQNLNFTLYSNGNIETTSTDESTTLDWSDRAPIGTTILITDFYSFEPNMVLGIPDGTYKRHDLSGEYDVVFSGEDILSLDITGKETDWGYLSSTGQPAYLKAWDLGGGNWALDDSHGGAQVMFTPILDAERPYQVGPYLLENCDQIMVNLYAQNGVYKTDGDIYPITVLCQMILTNPADPSSPEITHDVSISGRFSESVGATLRVDNPWPDAVNVTMRRIDNTDKDFEGSVSDSIKWRDLYAINNVPARNYGNVSLVHSVAKATNAALKQKERKLNMKAVRRYNGVAYENMADVILSMHTDPYFGRRTLATIDETDLRLVEQSLLDYFGDVRAIQVGYTFDDVSTTYEEALQTICSPVNCMPFQLGNVIHLWPELPQEKSAMQFGHAFKVPDTDKRTRSFSPPKNYTGVQIKYFDHDKLSYMYTTVGEETNLNKIDLLACQSLYLANIKANREMNKLRYQRITHETSTLSIGLQTSPGMRIDMIDNTRLNQTEGYVNSVNGLVLTLSDPVTLQTGVNYSITLTGRLGTLENIPITQGNDEFEIVLGSSPSVDIYTGWFRDKTAYVISADDLRSSLAMLVQSMEPSGRDNNYQVGLTCINYDNRYYKDDKPL
jgi:hypothetical protein